MHKQYDGLLLSCLCICSLNSEHHFVCTLPDHERHQAVWETDRRAVLFTCIPGSSVGPNLTASSMEASEASEPLVEQDPLQIYNKKTPKRDQAARS